MGCDQPVFDHGMNKVIMKRIQTGSALHRVNLIYALYRIALSFFLVALFLLTISNPLVGGSVPSLYLETVTIYSVLTLAGYLLLRYWFHYPELQVFVMLVIDVVALTLMVYANGGVSLQLSMLYIVSVMVGSILLPQGRALVIALLAVLAVVYQQVYFSIVHDSQMRAVGSVGLLAVSFVAVSFLGQVITRRLKLVEEEAALRTSQARQAEAINQLIIEQMPMGVLAFDREQRLLMINEAARQWLHQPEASYGWPLMQLSPSLAVQIMLAIQQDERRQGVSATAIDDAQLLEHRPPAQPISFTTHESQMALSVQLLALDARRLSDGASPIGATVVLLESLSRVNQQAQQMKLASLGRLTASIAHEIRNPLAAISQAGELLGEMNKQPDELTLIKMIQKQSVRLNQMVEDILQLSRRNTSKPEHLDLIEWLTSFQDHFVPNVTERINSQTYSRDQLSLVKLSVDADYHVEFDPFQLEQVLINLVNNGLHHGSKLHAKPHVSFHLRRLESGLVMLDVIDEGLGIPNKVLPSLFEPFYTTEAGGTGLGLYLSRAFCEANGASLWSIPQDQGACFRISFGV